MTAADLAMVLLVRSDGFSRAMPTVELDRVGEAVRDVAALGVPAVKVFASGDARDRHGSRGKSPDSLMARAIMEAKAADPAVRVMTETCLCSYTNTGECYLPGRNGHPDRRGTIEAIAEQAVAQAEAGADVVGPAAMISGSVRCVRRALDGTGHPGVEIMPHLIFDSRLYDPYRQTMEATPASGERRAFQLDPARPENALRASRGFVGEGADSLLLEPALFCADVLIGLKQACPVPLAPFSVSGEYLRLLQGDDMRLLAELFTMLKRSGADQIITYAAAGLARSLG